MEVELERLEGRLSLGHEIDLESYSRIAQRLHAILAGLGLKRVARPVDGLDAYAEPMTAKDVELFRAVAIASLMATCAAINFDPTRSKLRPGEKARVYMPCLR